MAGVCRQVIYATRNADSHGLCFWQPGRLWERGIPFTGTVTIFKLTAEWHIEVIDLTGQVLVDFGAATSQGRRIQLVLSLALRPPATFEIGFAN